MLFSLLRSAPAPHRPILLKNKIRKIVIWRGRGAGWVSPIWWNTRVPQIIMWNGHRPVLRSRAFRRKNGTIHPARPFTIGWIGAPRLFISRLAAIPADSGTRKTRILSAWYMSGSGPVQYEGSRRKFILGRRQTEVNEILKFDVGIMPLPDEPWTRGKCAFKLIQYMACGLPVVASPVGMNRDVVEPGTNGFLASSTEDWVRAFETLAGDVNLRRQMGANGRRRVERDFTTQVGGRKLLQAIRSAAASKPKVPSENKQDGDRVAR